MTWQIFPCFHCNTVLFVCQVANKNCLVEMLFCFGSRYYQVNFWHKHLYFAACKYIIVLDNIFCVKYLHKKYKCAIL